MEEGKKFDGGKLRYDLIPPEALKSLVEIYTYGANKYGERNWEKGILYSRIYAAVMRHLQDWFMGEEYDRESGLHHLSHATWGLFTLRAYVDREMLEFDDRMKFSEYNQWKEGGSPPDPL
jgi:hypothetical protein